MKITGNTIGLIGDMHLGKNTSEEWYQSYTELLAWIKESFYGKTTTLMFQGDVFDGKIKKTDQKSIDFRMLTFCYDFFDELSKDFEIIVYAGNHCCYYKDRCDVSALPILKGRKNITVVEDSTTFSVDGKCYRIVPWSCSILTGDDPSEYYDGVFGHFDIQSFKMNNVKESDHGYSTKELFNACDRVYTGHYHLYQHREYQKGAKSITYVGSPLQLSWSEAGKDSFIFLLDLSKNEIVEEFKNDFSPRFTKIRASNLIDDPSKCSGDILEVIWDIPNSEENQIKIGSLLEVNKNFSYKNNHTHSISTTDTLSEIKDVSDSVDDEEVVRLFTDKIEVSTENVRQRVLAESLEIMDNVK